VLVAWTNLEETEGVAGKIGLCVLVIVRVRELILIDRIRLEDI
jgi:hypothetical protein